MFWQQNNKFRYTTLLSGPDDGQSSKDMALTIRNKPLFARIAHGAKDGWKKKKLARVVKGVMDTVKDGLVRAWETVRRIEISMSGGPGVSSLREVRRSAETTSSPKCYIPLDFN